MQGWERVKQINFMGRESEVFPAPWVLAASPTCPEPCCPLQRCSGVPGVPLQLSWHFATLPALCKRSIVPHQRAPLFPKHPADQAGTPPCPPLPISDQCRRSSAMCCLALVCCAPHWSQPCSRALGNLPLIRTLFGFVGEESDEYFPSP